MKCSTPRSAFRPCLENLESRLQPGSIITGQGYGWSLLADSLSILDQGALDSPALVSPSSSESNQPSWTSTPTDPHSDHLAIMVASVTAARTETLAVPVSNAVAPMVNTLAGDLTNDGLANLSLT